MDNTILNKFAKGLMWAILAGYLVAMVASLISGEYRTAFGLVVKSMIIIGIHFLGS